MNSFVIAVATSPITASAPTRCDLYTASCMGSRPQLHSSRDAFRLRYLVTSERKKITTEKNHRIVIFHVCVGAPLSNRLRWKFAPLLRSTTLSIMPSLVVVCLGVWFPRGAEFRLTCSLQHCFCSTALACDLWSSRVSSLSPIRRAAFRRSSATFVECYPRALLPLPGWTVPAHKRTRPSWQFALDRSTCHRPTPICRCRRSTTSSSVWNSP
jgi:hypothetical protein